MADIKALEASAAGKITDARCVACGKNEWNAAGNTYVLTAIGPGGVEFGNGTEVFPFFCRNCGYVQMHATDYL